MMHEPASTSEPTTQWPISLPLETLPQGPALSPELLAIEENVGVTRDVLWAYAEAMPKLLGNAIMEDVSTLGFGRGALVAIATDIVVDLPHVRHVQTSSVEVCRAMGNIATQFHVRGRDCLDALIQFGTAVTHVWVRNCEPFEVHAPFTVEFLALSSQGPTWAERYGRDHLTKIGALDDKVWLCWDRDLSKPVIWDESDRIFDGRWGPRDVAPEKHPPPWASQDARECGGEGWAATVLECERRSLEAVVVETDRRWFLLYTFPMNRTHASLVDAWRNRRPLRDSVHEKSGVFAVGADLELRGHEAIFRWVGFHQVWRLRDGVLEKLTTNHDLQWLVAQDPEAYPAETLPPAHQLQNIIATGLLSHDMSVGTCDVKKGDRFILLESSAHFELLKAAGDKLADRLGQGSVREVARWAMKVLRSDDAQTSHLVVFVDSDATVTQMVWQEEPVLMVCEPGEDRSWQLVTTNSAQPAKWPDDWRMGVEKQWAAGKLLQEKLNDGDVLRFPRIGYAFQWRDGQWHDVNADRQFKELAAGRLTIPDRGAIELAAKVPIHERAEALETAGFRAEAEWLRAITERSGMAAWALGNRLGETTKLQIGASSFIQTDTYSLIDKPRDFHLRRIRARGIYTCRPERRVFADAWFSCATEFPPGVWVVTAEGDWFCNDEPRGPHGNFAAEIQGDAQLVPIDKPRPITLERARFSRRYVPLVIEAPITRGLQGWTFDKRWMVPLGNAPPLPRSSSPETCRARIVFAFDVNFTVGVFSYELLEPWQKLQPESATPREPGYCGRFVEMQGELVPTNDSWPLLNGILPVVPAPTSLSSARTQSPSPELLQSIRERLGHGLRVRVRGEVGARSQILHALTIEGPRGLIEFD